MGGRAEERFNSIGAVVHYDASDRVFAIGFADVSRLLYDGLDLFRTPAAEVLSWALARDPALDSAEGFTSKPLGLHMYAPGLGAEGADSRAPAEAFLVFREGYWEEEESRLAAR